jgi:hypothetical protein
MYSCHVFAIRIFFLYFPCLVVLHPHSQVPPAAFNSAVEVTSTSQWLGRTMTEWTKDDLPPPLGEPRGGGGVHGVIRCQ